MNFSLLQWATWLMGHKAILPDLIRNGEILFSSESSLSQKIQALRAILDIVDRLQADAPVKLFGAADPDDDAEPTEVAAFESEAKEQGINVILLLKIAAILMQLFGGK